MPGSHGSLTKAGKVRTQTPKVQRRGINSHPKKIPRIRYRENYKKRIIKGEYGGQTGSIGAKRRYRK
ncbi:MAG: 30S ribosomal protein S30e [Candidatus Lokiarchaeota archaeon]|nr:30S ribosomal protein S30e [Candidatus Lokiarchaeota archaeon]MCK4280999.1 30S ribosomal protein S30e [Candidatus Lokiarchaeota archaeon]